jgi:hypothetical protein
MDQYKRTDGNPSLRRSVSTKVEGTNEIAQLKSEIILLKRQNERLLKKEKRIQVKKNEGICPNTKKEHQINKQQKFYSDHLNDTEDSTFRAKVLRRKLDYCLGSE